MSALRGITDMTRTWRDICMPKADPPTSASMRPFVSQQITRVLFDVPQAAESVCAESTPAYGRFGDGNVEVARAVSVPGALTSKRCISARDEKEIQANDVR